MAEPCRRGCQRFHIVCVYPLSFALRPRRALGAATETAFSTCRHTYPKQQSAAFPNFLRKAAL